MGLSLADSLRIAMKQSILGNQCFYSLSRCTVPSAMQIMAAGLMAVDKGTLGDAVFVQADTSE